MDLKPLGQTGLSVSVIGFGAFKIGRNTGIKYPNAYPLPTEREVETLLNGVLDLGVNLIDTAPAYGLSEQRIGHTIAHRRDEFVLSSKVGEIFEGGRSRFDFSTQGIRDSVHRSLERLRTDVLDVLYLHSNGEDLKILNETDAVAALVALKKQGLVKAIGLSGKTVAGAEAALAWADAIMVEYHANDRSHEAVITQTGEAGVGVVVKKGLASGHLPAAQAIGVVLDNPHVTSLVIGGLNLDHFHQNIRHAETHRGRS